VSSILNISPIDGRYASKTKDLQNYLSEYALIKYRTQVEISWLIFLANKKIINTSISKKEAEELKNIIVNFSVSDAERVKEIEKTTNHDVKAVEYFLREKFNELNLGHLNPFIHIFLTSEDVNNTSYSLMMQDSLYNVYFKKLFELITTLNDLSFKYKDTAMLGHTHGQIATPTTIGKEFKVFYYRLNSLYNSLKQVKLCSKFGGTVGNFNCHMVACPEVDWLSIAEEFVTKVLGLSYNPVSTQIEPHDTLCVALSYIKIINNIVKDLNSDMWLYISNNYFVEKMKEGEVGSSVMPHKVNPINHENSMANTEVANGLIDALVNNLPISRMQRDLSDSSKLRNLGVILGHCVVSVTETIKGLNKIVINEEKLSSQLSENYTVLAEAIQTMLRKNGVANAYELLKGISRGKVLTKQDLEEFISTLPIPQEDKQTLINLTPSTYLGLSSKIVEKY